MRIALSWLLPHSGTAHALWLPLDDHSFVTAPFVDLDTRIAMKRNAGRSKDRDDLEHLLAIRAQRQRP